MSATARSTSTRCSTRSFPAHATMMLGAQDRERPGQGPTLGAGHHEGFARGLAGANRASAEAATDVFGEKYCAKYGRAVECLVKDREAPLAFYDFLGRTLGITCAPQIPSSACSPPGDTGPCGRKGSLSPTPPGRWCSSW